MLFCTIRNNSSWFPSPSWSFWLISHNEWDSVPSVAAMSFVHWMKLDIFARFCSGCQQSACETGFRDRGHFLLIASNAQFWAFWLRICIRSISLCSTRSPAGFEISSHIAGKRYCEYLSVWKRALNVIYKRLVRNDLRSVPSWDEFSLAVFDASVNLYVPEVLKARFSCARKPPTVVLELQDMSWSLPKNTCLTYLMLSFQWRLGTIGENAMM